MMRRPLLWALVISMLAFLPVLALAERRDRDRDDDKDIENASSSVLQDHLVTQSYMTLEPREFEVDLWSRYAKGLRGTSDADYWAHAVEAEFGLMKRWQIGVGANFQQPKSGSFSYTGLEVETRFRFGEPGKWFMNPAVSLDYEIPKDVGSDNPGGLEGRLILDKEKNGLGVVLNAIYEQGFQSGSEGEFGYAAGLFKSVTKSVNAGVEFQGNFSEDEQAHYAIPGLYLRLGKKARLNLGTSFGLTDESEPFGVRGFLEFEFD